MLNRILNKENFIEVFLNEPWWGAWKKYGWKTHCEGLGVSRYVLRIARAENKRIIVTYKYGSYSSTWKRIENYLKENKSVFIARDGTKIFVLPRYIFDRVNSKNDVRGTAGSVDKLVQIQQPKLFGLD